MLTRGVVLATCTAVVSSQGISSELDSLLRKTPSTLETPTTLETLETRATYPLDYGGMDFYCDSTGRH